MPHKDFFESLLELKGMSEREWSKQYDTDRPLGRVAKRQGEIDRILSARERFGEIVWESKRGQQTIDFGG